MPISDKELHNKSSKKKKRRNETGVVWLLEWRLKTIQTMEMH